MAKARAQTFLTKRQVKQFSNTNDMLYVIGAQICIPHLVFSLLSLPWLMAQSACLTPSDTVLTTAKRKSKQIFLCYEFTINIEHECYVHCVLCRGLAYLSKSANGLLCAYKSTTGGIYSAKVSSLADKCLTVKGWWEVGSISKHIKWVKHCSSIHTPCYYLLSPYLNLWHLLSNIS